MNNKKIIVTGLILFYSINFQSLILMGQLNWRENFSSLLLLTVPLLFIFYINLVETQRNSKFVSFLIIMLLCMGVSIKLYSMSLYIPQMNQVLDGRIRGQSLQSDYSLMALFNTISMIGYMCFFNLKTYFNEKFHLKNIRYMLYGVALFYSLYSLALALLDTRIFELFYNQGFVIFYGFLNSFLFLVALFMVLKQLKREFSQIKYLTINIVVYLSIALMTGALILNNTFVDYQTLQFLIQLSLVLVLFIRSIYIGLSKYLRSDKKIVLYILSSFPIYFLVKYAFFGVDFVNIIANNLIIKLTIVAIFSQY